MPDAKQAPQDLGNQRFTIIGGAGFIGARLAQALRARGGQVWLPQRHADWCSEQPLGHVFYCAGLTADYLARPFDTVQAHVGHLSQVLQARHWDSLVYLSSTRLYDGLKGGLAREDATLPIRPALPRHLYDLSKALGESLCHVVGQGRARVARLACVYDGPQDADGFLAQLVRRAMAAARQESTSIDVDSSPHFARDYVHLADVVEALILVALQGRQPAYNVASGVNVSNAELFQYIHQRWSCRIEPLSQVVPPAVPQVDIARLRNELHWQPRSLFEMLDQWPQELPC